MKFGLRTPGILVAVTALLALSGCKIEERPPTSDMSTLALIRIDVGGQDIIIDEGGLRDCCDGEGNATLNTRVTITADGEPDDEDDIEDRTELAIVSFHQSDGFNIVADPALYEARLVPEHSRITFTRLSSFTGELYREAGEVGVTMVEVTIVETATGNTIFGPHDFYICTESADEINTCES